MTVLLAYTPVHRLSTCFFVNLFKCTFYEVLLLLAYVVIVYMLFFLCALSHISHANNVCFMC
jgi:hypothetical protein